MTEYDMGQASLIHLIKQSYQLFDVGAIGALRGVGRNIALDSGLALDELEGEVEEIRPGVYGLPVCPFAEAISTFKTCCGQMPEEMYELAAHANKRGEAWVSAFCGIHQSIRSTRIGEEYQQIACKSGPKVSIADQDILTDEEARAALENYACIYAK